MRATCVCSTVKLPYRQRRLRRNGSPLKSHHELALTGEQVKTRGFDGEQIATADSLYNWSKLRANYLGQANLSLAEEYAGNPGFYPRLVLGFGALFLHLAARRWYVLGVHLA